MVFPLNRVLDNLTVAQLIKKFTAFYRTQNFITMFTRIHHYLEPHEFNQNFCNWYVQVHFIISNPCKPRSAYSRYIFSLLDIHKLHIRISDAQNSSYKTRSSHLFDLSSLNNSYEDNMLAVSHYVISEILSIFSDRRQIPEAKKRHSKQNGSILQLQSDLHCFAKVTIFLFFIWKILTFAVLCLIHVYITIFPYSVFQHWSKTLPWPAFPTPVEGVCVHSPRQF